MRRPLFLVVLSIACASSASPPQNPAPATVGVRPGDVISIRIWREPDYTGEWTVDARGRVVLPTLGEIRVEGRAAEALTDSLKKAFRQYLNNPSIEINVQRRIAVGGEVGRPGFVLADPTITIGDLIALAGGITPLGNRNKVMLLRGGQVVVSALGPGTILQRSPLLSGDQVYVPQRSWLSRNGQVFIYGAISITSAVTVGLIMRR